MRVLVGCLTTNAESAGFLHNAEVLTLCHSFALPTTRFSSLQLSPFLLPPISLFLLPFMNHLPFSHLLLISHSNISSHLLLPLSLVIFLVSVSLSRLRLVLPHVLPLLLSLFSTLFFQVPRTSSYLHFAFVVFFFLRTLPLLLPFMTSLLSHCYSIYHPLPLLYTYFHPLKPSSFPGYFLVSQFKNFFNLLAPELFFFNFSTPVYEM